MSDNKEGNNNNRKRSVVSIYDSSKVPEYGRDNISSEWNVIIRQKPPDDIELLFFYVAQLYDLAIFNIRNNVVCTDRSELEPVFKLVRDLQKIVSSSKATELRRYNQTCADGKLSLMSCIFLCICAINQYILICINNTTKLTPEQYDQAFEWAYKNRVVLLDKDSFETWSQMMMYIQVQTLATVWSSLKRGENNSAFYFMILLEDRLSTLLTLQHKEDVMDGSGSTWVTRVSDIVTASIEYIDDIANMFVGFYRSLYIFERISKFKKAEIPRHLFDTYKDEYYKWLKNEMYDPVLADYVDDSRSTAIYYCVREGEIERAIREKNGVRSKSIKWSLHVSRVYKQITWMLQEHTYDKKGNVLKALPRSWQIHCLKLNVFVNFMGGFNLKLNDHTFIQERYFWEKLQLKEVFKNPFLVEIMGEHVLIHEGSYYQVECFEDGMLLWFILMDTKSKGIFKAELKTVDMKVTISTYLRTWDKQNVIDRGNVKIEITEENDIVL